MSKTTSREIRLISRPKGIPTAANFTLARIELAPPQDGQVLVHNRYMSVDPYMRGRMNSGKSYVPPFDNVGGEALEAALSALRVHGRIIACGGISGYNDEKPRPGPSNLFNITTKRLTMKGLMVFDWLDRQAEFEKEVGGYFKAGKVKHKETVVKGIDQAVGAFLGLFRGQNVGKMVVELG